jgi:predicted lipoprotein with Yx(FWY)xxD motif
MPQLKTKQASVYRLGLTLSALAISVLLLAACVVNNMPATATTKATETPAASTAMTSTTAMTGTESMSGTEATTATTAMTSTAAMTGTEATTNTAAMTGTEAMTSTAAPTSTAAMTETAGVAVKVSENINLGKILVDDKGMTLYIFDKDTQGKSNCTGDCANNWPPFTLKDATATVTAGDGVSGKLDVIDRGDGTYQVTANGMPLYYFIKDKNSGDVNGQGVGDVWWVVADDGNKVTKK